MKTSRIHLWEIGPESFNCLIDQPDSISPSEKFSLETDLLMFYQLSMPFPYLWASRIKLSNVFVGACGLAFADEDGVLEIGFRMLKKYQNNGYATETIECLLEFAFENLSPKSIVACVSKSNRAARRVIEKCGMRYAGDRVHYGEIKYYFQIDATDYVKQRELAEQNSENNNR